MMSAMSSLSLSTDAWHLLVHIGGLPGDQQRAGSLKTSCWSCDPTLSVSVPTMLVTVIKSIVWKMHNCNKKGVHSEARRVGICCSGRARKLLRELSR